MGKAARTGELFLEEVFAISEQYFGLRRHLGWDSCGLDLIMAWTKKVVGFWSMECASAAR